MEGSLQSFEDSILSANSATSHREGDGNSDVVVPDSQEGSDLDILLDMNHSDGNENDGGGDVDEDDELMEESSSPEPSEEDDDDDDDDEDQSDEEDEEPFNHETAELSSVASSNDDLDDGDFTDKIDNEILKLNEITEWEAARTKDILIKRDSVVEGSAEEQQLHRNAVQFLNHTLRSMAADNWLYEASEAVLLGPRTADSPSTLQPALPSFIPKFRDTNSRGTRPVNLEFPQLRMEIDD